MFNPRELEGEVDHTFFDSGSEEGEECKKQDHKQTTIDNSRKSTKMHLKPEENMKTKKHSRTVNNNTNSDYNEEIIQTISTKPLMALLTEAQCDAVESEKNAELSKIKKQVTKFRCSVSSEASRDADYVGNSSDKSNSDSESDMKHSRASSSTTKRIGSTTSGDVHSVSSDDCNNTVTNVSPLSSATSSRLQSLDLNQSETEEDKSVPSSGRNGVQHYERVSMGRGHYSSHLRGKVVLQFSRSRHRKNYSFTNSEIKRIDRDNQLLLQQISRASSQSRQESVTGQRHCVRSNTPLNRISHSAINRQKELERIEQENLALLKRLQSVKPTPGMKRTEQLADYQRQVGYLGICPIYEATRKKSSSRVSSGKAPKPTARATSTTTESSRRGHPNQIHLSATDQARQQK